jgi:hypothetical protein
MTSTQTFKLYELANRYFKNQADAQDFITEIENVVDNKFTERKEILATKIDIAEMRTEIHKSKNALMWALIVMILPLYALIVFQIIHTH